MKKPIPFIILGSLALAWGVNNLLAETDMPGRAFSTSISSESMSSTKPLSKANPSPSENTSLDQILIENRELIKEHVTSLDSELAQVTKTLKDKSVTPQKKASVMKAMYVNYVFGFPQDCDELVQTLSELLKEETTSRYSKKWILKCFQTMGKRASKAESAIEYFLKHGRSYKGMAKATLALVAPKNAFLQEILIEAIHHPEIPDHAKKDAALYSIMTGHPSAKALEFMVSEAERRRELGPHELMQIAIRAEDLPEAARKRLLKAVAEPTKKSYDGLIKNYFLETLKRKPSKAMESFAESLKVNNMSVISSIQHLSQLKKSDIKPLVPVLVDFMKQNPQGKSIAYLLTDL